MFLLVTLFVLALVPLFLGEFRDVLGTVGLINGTAALSTADLPAGQHVILATYLGDDNFLPSTGSTALEVLLRA